MENSNRKSRNRLIVKAALLFIACFLGAFLLASTYRSAPHVELQQKNRELISVSAAHQSLEKELTDLKGYILRSRAINAKIDSLLPMMQGSMESKVSAQIKALQLDRQKIDYPDADSLMMAALHEENIHRDHLLTLGLSNKNDCSQQCEDLFPQMWNKNKGELQERIARVIAGMQCKCSDQRLQSLKDELRNAVNEFVVRS